WRGFTPIADVAAGPRSAAAVSESETGTLSSADLEDLVAFGEVLVGSGTLAPAERRDLVEHIEDRARDSPQYLSIYRTSVNALARLAGRRFAGLGTRERTELVARHRLGASQVWPGEDLGPFPEETRIVRTRAVR